MNDRRRALIFAAVLVAAIALRLALFSGYGLGDDPGYFLCYRDILETGTFNATRGYNYRFSFWIPVVLFLRHRTTGGCAPTASLPELIGA